MEDLYSTPLYPSLCCNGRILHILYTVSCRTKKS